MRAHHRHEFVRGWLHGIPCVNDNNDKTLTCPIPHIRARGAQCTSPLRTILCHMYALSMPADRSDGRSVWVSLSICLPQSVSRPVGHPACHIQGAVGARCAGDDEQHPRLSTVENHSVSHVPPHRCVRCCANRATRTVTPSCS